MGRPPGTVLSRRVSSAPSARSCSPRPTTLRPDWAALGLPGLRRLRHRLERQGHGPVVRDPPGGRRPPRRQAGRAPRPPGRPTACPAHANQPARSQRRPGLRSAPPPPLNLRRRPAVRTCQGANGREAHRSNRRSLLSEGNEHRNDRHARGVAAAIRYCLSCLVGLAGLEPATGGYEPPALTD